MITITNITDPPVSNAKLNYYELAINGSVLAAFNHYPVNGLAVCLLKASWAAEEISKLERSSRFPNETKPDPEEVPDETDGLRCEEVLHAEAQATEAGLEEKDRLAEGIQRPEEDPWNRTLLLAMQIGDLDRTQRGLASSLRAENAGNLVVRDTGLRPLS